MEPLSNATFRLADTLDRAATGDDPRAYQQEILRITWPGDSPETTALRSDLEGFVARLTRLRDETTLRKSLERLATRYRYLGDRFARLEEALREIAKYQTHIEGMPSPEEIGGQEWSSETVVDAHRMQAILLRRSYVRAAIQREHITGTLSDHDPRPNLQTHHDELHRLELERLLLIRESDEPRRGLDLQIEAARAMIDGDKPRALALREAAERQYRDFVSLSKLGALAPLRTIAERAASGRGYEDEAWMTRPRFGDELARLARWARERTVFVAGSTHDGDEVAVARALSRISGALPRPLLFVVAPRGTHRGSRVKEELDAYFDVVAQLRSMYEVERPNAVVIDFAGILRAIYALADGAFIGGGRAALRDHNFGEPLAYGIPTYTTPYRQWAPERWELLESRAPGLLEVVMPDALEEMASSFLRHANDPDRLAKRTERARAFLSIASEAEDNALSTLEALGEERIGWLERVRDEGADAWAECPHREELLELGLLVGPRLGLLGRYRDAPVQPATLTRLTIYLLGERAARRAH